MKKIIFLLSLVLIIVFSSGCNLWKNADRQNQETEKVSKDAPKTLAENPIANATFIFDFGDGTTKNFVLQIDGDKTVYDLLTTLAGQNQIKLETQESSLGILIQAIDGFTNGQDNKYWIYYLNGQMANTGVKDQKVSPEDQIEFKFEANPF